MAGETVDVSSLRHSKETGGSVWRITRMDFCIHVHGWIPDSGETTIKGVHKQWGDTD